MPEARRRQRVLVVGMGGLGCPVASVLARVAEIELWLADDDVVDASNLHRQILYREEDVGRDKLLAAEQALLTGGAAPGAIVPVKSRLLPDNARELVRQVDLVVEGADNYATKFLAADAAFLEQRPIIHGAAIRLVATAWAVAAGGSPCYRCLFEDLPVGAQQGCSDAGVLGPVVGIAGALIADLALSVLSGEASVFGSLTTYDGARDRLRRVAVAARRDCALCGQTEPRIREVQESRYLQAHSAA